MKRTHGSYSKRSRNLVKKGRRTAVQILKSYPVGERVRISAFSGSKQGRPHLRFNRLVGKVIGRQGKAYKVQVRTGNKQKLLVVSNTHLDPV